MAYKTKSNDEKKAMIDNAFKTIEQQIPQVFESESYKNYLDTMSKFHNYSINNQILIAVQKPEATHVAGFNTWKTLERSVNKGEKGIMILAPTPYKVKREVDKKDENGNVVKNEKGETVKETQEVQAMSYRAVYVFDISQTSGKELNLNFVNTLEGNSREARDLLEAVEAVSSYPINYKTPDEDSTLAGGAKGYFNQTTGEITVNNNLALDQKAKTLIHEFAHANLHNGDLDKSREQKEIEAESIAYAVSNYFGLDTSDYSFPYVASWAKGKETDELRSILSNIQKATDDIINQIEDTYIAVKEKNKDLEFTMEEVSEPEKVEEKISEPEQIEEIPDSQSEEVEEPEVPVEAASQEVKETIEEPTASQEVVEEPEVPTEETQIEQPESDTSDETESNSEEEIEEVPEEPKEDAVETPSVEIETGKDTSVSEKKEENSKNNIVDFGEKVVGARKDEWKTRGLLVDDLSEMNSAERNKLVKKDNVWPKPDYQELVNNGLPVEVAYFYKLVRDATPTKPDIKRYCITAEDIKDEQKKYVAFVSDLKQAVLNCKSLSDIMKMETWLQDNDYVEKRGYYGLSPTSKASGYIDNKIYKAIISGKDVFNLRKEINKNQFCFTEDQKILSNYNIIPYVKDMISFEKDYKDRDMMVIGKSSKVFLYPEDPEYASAEKYKDGTFFVISNSREFLGKNFETQKEAEEFCLNHYKELHKDQPVEEKKETKRKTALKFPQFDKLERIGPEYRENNRDAVPDDFLNEFGIKGVAFGNWVKTDSERQLFLNSIYDSFNDMCSALDIKTENIGNKNLSLGIGSHGRGSATGAACYFPELETINLTRFKNFGSLGHEMIHYFDDLAGKKLGIDGMLSQNILNKNVPASFKELMQSLKYRSLTIEEVKQQHVKHFDKEVETLRKGLNNISRKGSTPELETKRQELINNVVEEAKNNRNYDCYSLARNKLVVDKTPSPAFKEFCDFQAKEMNDTNPQSNKNKEWCNIRRGLISRALGTLENPQEYDLKGRTETKFYKDAQKIDDMYSKSDKGYWSSEVEMLARAGAAYIADKCKELGIKNDFLSGHAEMIVPINDEKCSISPLGEERKTINKAFDKFFNELKELGVLESPEQEISSLDDKLAAAEKKCASQNCNKKDEISKDDLTI